MPFRSMEQDGVLTSTDLEVLQDIYESAGAHVSHVDDTTMHEVVRTLIKCYRAGETDRERLIAIVARGLRRSVR